MEENIGSGENASLLYINNASVKSDFIRNYNKAMLEAPENASIYDNGGIKDLNPLPYKRNSIHKVESQETDRNYTTICSLIAKTALELSVAALGEKFWGEEM